MDSLMRWRKRLARGSHSGPIGLELSLQQLHMVQLQRRGESLGVRAFTSVDYADALQGVPHPLPDNSSADSTDSGERPAEAIRALLHDTAALKRIVARALQNAKFSGRKVVAAMPSSMVRVMPVSYQVRSGESSEVAIGQLMAERLGEEVSELVIDYMPVQTLAQSDAVPADERNTERLALVAVCRRDAVLSFIEQLRLAGLSVQAVEIGPIAIRRLIAVMQKNQPLQNTLVLNCGRQKSYLTVLADERLLADDEIDVGELNFVREVAKRLELPDELAARLVSTTDLAPGADTPDDSSRMLKDIMKPLMRTFVREAERGLVYAGSESRGARPTRVYLLGSLARWNGADAWLESLLDVPVSIIPNPVSLFGVDSSEASPELAVATGLALKPEVARA